MNRGPIVNSSLLVDRELYLTRDEEDRAIRANTLLNRGEGTCLGPAFDKIWPVTFSSSFDELLTAIDEADQAEASGKGQR